MQPGDAIITIDGPVGSGKSTIGRMLAARRKLVYLDTGALYRVVALEACRRRIDDTDAGGLAELCRGLRIDFENRGGSQRVFSGGEDVTDAIRTPEMSMRASRISAVGTVRTAMLDLQRSAGRRGGIVVDGRDAGTVVFPHAHCKFYLDATAEERARRRYKELLEKGMDVVYTDIFQDVQKRDHNDTNRALAPLRPAEDARIIDTTAMSTDEVLDRLDREVDSRLQSLTYIPERKRGPGV